MVSGIMNKPDKTEYAPFYQGYIDMLPEEVDIFKYLKRQENEFVEWISTYSEADLNFRYAPGKWTRRELIGHVVDVERLMSFRAFTFLRGDDHELPGFEQDDYVRNGDFSYRSLASLKAEIAGLRMANLELFSTLIDKPEKLKLKGKATGKTFTVKALLFILAGHMQHHFQVLKSKYDLT